MQLNVVLYIFFKKNTKLFPYDTRISKQLYVISHFIFNFYIKLYCKMATLHNFKSINSAWPIISSQH